MLRSNRRVEEASENSESSLVNLVHCCLHFILSLTCSSDAVCMLCEEINHWGKFKQLHFLVIFPWSDLHFCHVVASNRDTNDNLSDEDD